MAEGRVGGPPGEVRGVGEVRYRCAGCGLTSAPEEQIVIDGRSYHPEHRPKGDKASGR